MSTPDPIRAALWRLIYTVEGIELEGVTGVDDALAEARAALAVVPVEPSKLSDGYHTFAELYEHRHSLMLAFMRAVPNLCWFSQRHSDGELPFGSSDWFIVGADLPTGPITYHLPIALLALAQQTGAQELTVGRAWDGHTSDDVIPRLRAWAAAPADGEVEELAEWLDARGREGLESGLKFAQENGRQLTRTAALLRQLSAAPAAAPAVATPGEEYHDDLGPVLWWRFPVEEPPYAGTPGDSDWPGYHTHFTPLPAPPALPTTTPDGQEVANG